jgi:hypothetical protein
VVPRFNPPHQWVEMRDKDLIRRGSAPVIRKSMKPDELGRLAESMDFSG